MLINWTDQSQKLGIPTRKNEHWRYSQVKDFITTDLSLSSELIKKPQLPTELKGEIIYFNGKEWVSEFKKIESNDELSVSKIVSDQDGMYAWYKKQIQSTTLEITKAAKIIICIPHIKDQLLLPELTLNLNQAEDEVTIYEIQTAESIDLAASVYSLKIINKNKNLTYHRLSLNPNVKSISWLNINNSSNLNTYIWKQKNSQNKEFITVDNVKTQASTRLSLVANLDENAKYDLITHLNHFVGHTSSNQLFKCILDDNAQAALTGKIFIGKNCPETKAYFKSKQTLLSSKAHIFSQPQLEIHTDDVECAHGSSTGSLQAEELFYLTSRGISPTKAKQMLLGAFINDEIMTLKNTDEQIFFQGLIL